MKAFIDSDILIWHLRGEPRALNLLSKLHNNENIALWTGAMQRAEVVFFMRPTEEETTLLFLSQFETASVDQWTIDKAGELFRKWNPSNGTDVNDAILAATAIRAGGQLFTLNTKHYPMPELAVERPWKVL